jgi:hypothetical protein
MESHICNFPNCTEFNSVKLSPNDSDLLSRRSNINIEQCNQLCKVHYDRFIRLYTVNQKKCCDPFKKHKKTIAKDLRTISLEFVREVEHKIKLIPGQKLCKHCLIAVNKTNTSTDSSTEDEGANKSSTSSEGIVDIQPEPGCSTQYEPVQKTLGRFTLYHHI